LAGLLLLAGALLPPVSLIERIQNYGYTPLTSAQPAHSHPDGLTVSVDAGAADGSFNVRLGALPRQDFVDGRAGSDWETARAALPAWATLKSPIYTVAARGPVPEQVLYTFAIPNEAEPYNRLDVLAWDGKDWSWLPSRIDPQSLTLVTDLGRVPAALAIVHAETAAAEPVMAADLAGGGAARPMRVADTSFLNVVAATGLQLGPNGTLDGEPVRPEATTPAFAVVRNYTDPAQPDSDSLFVLLGNPQMQIDHVAALLNRLEGSGYAGLVLDYRGVDPAQREGFTGLATLLAGELHSRGLQMAVVVEPAAAGDGAYQGGGYDWRALGAAADILEVALPADPLAYGPDGPVARLLDWAVGEVDRRKLQLGVSTLSVDWLGDDQYRLVGYADALAPLGEVVLAGEPDGTSTVEVHIGTPITVSLNTSATAPVFDEDAQTTRYSYVDAEGQVHTVWFGTARLLANRIRFVTGLNLRGVTTYDLLAEGSDRELVAGYGEVLAGVSAVAANAPELTWQVNDAAGALLLEATASFEQPDFSWQAPETPGAYVIEGKVSGGPGAELGAVRVEVAAGPTITPTDTLTPTPTYTATPKPTPTPCPPPFCTPTPTRTPTATRAPTNTPGPTNTAGPTNTRQAPPPPPPSSGGFLPGVQININGDYGRAMPLAAGLGVRYIKAQVRWAWMEGSPGAINWGHLDGVVNVAAANGLGVLASVLQAPDWNLSCADHGCAPADRQAAANFMGALAGRYCGRVIAIEVWNETNLDREWGPTPDPAAYTDLLRRAYAAIKGACSSTIVISGAPAPTGVHAPGGCCWDDFIYFSEMVNNGALSYMDCIGAHANANIIPPSWGSDQDPRGNHHSWTFRDTVTGYYNIGGGRRQICLTEFGIPTGDAHGGVPPGFEWAAQNSLDEQTAWVAEGFNMRHTLPIFRMITLWNLDFYPSCGGCVDQNSPYSILDGGFNPLPAYYALQNVLR
jgi:spore germination protein YaaH